MAHYFDREQDSLLHPKIIKFAVQGKTFEFIVGSGVFSKDRLDQGSRMLIEHGIIRENWRVLDMGCGYGPVGITVKQLYPSIEVTLADVNERAMELTKLNLKRYNP
jgi:16S rRNA G1207 methylase RsmC